MQLGDGKKMISTAGVTFQEFRVLQTNEALY
jgi:hypothetical protein